MATEDDPAAGSGQEWVVIASFENRHAAEHMLASLGHKFRRNARRGHAEAFVVSGNADGSLKLTESRVLEASGFAATTIRLSLSWTVGFMGLVSTLKGAKATTHAAHERESHVGSDEERAHEIIAQAGPSAAIALVRCKDRETGRMVAAGAAERASYSWDGSMTDFLAGLDPGSKHDWVRAALNEPTSPKTWIIRLRVRLTLGPLRAPERRRPPPRRDEARRSRLPVYAMQRITPSSSTQQRRDGRLWIAPNAAPRGSTRRRELGLPGELGLLSGRRGG